MNCIVSLPSFFKTLILQNHLFHFVMKLCITSCTLVFTLLRTCIPSLNLFLYGSCSVDYFIYFFEIFYLPIFRSSYNLKPRFVFVSLYVLYKPYLI